MVKLHCIILFLAISEEEKSKSEEFMNQMKELELLLKEAQDEHSALLAKMEDENAKFQEVLTKREETISHLQEELERANELIQAAKAGLYKIVIFYLLSSTPITTFLLLCHKYKVKLFF